MNAVYADQPMTARRARMIAHRGEDLIQELNRLGEGADLPEWLQAKIENAYQMIDSAFDYLEQMNEIEEISESDLLKARATKYDYRRMTGRRDPKTGRPIYTYYYNKPKTARGIKSLVDKAHVGTSFVYHHRGQRGHFHIEEVNEKEGSFVIVHDETGHKASVTKAELRKILLMEHERHLQEHAEHTAKRAVERGRKTKSGTHKGAERRARRAAELAQEAKSAGESVAAALGEKPKPKPKKKPAAPEPTPSADNFETMPEGEDPAAKLRQEYERPQFGRYNLSFKSLLEGGINMWGTVKLSKEDARAILAFYYDATLESLKTGGAFFEELGLSSKDNRTALVRFKERAEGMLPPQEGRVKKQNFTFTKNKLVRTPFMLESLKVLRNEDLSNEEKLTALTETFAKYDPSRDYTSEGLQFRIKRILKNLKDSIRDTHAYMDEQYKRARELGREDELPPLSFNEMGKAQFRDLPLAKYYLKEDFYSIVEMEENLNNLEDPLGFLKRLAEVARGPAEKKRARLLAGYYKTVPKKEPTPSADNFETMPESEAPSSPAAQAREELAEVAATAEPTPSADNFETMPEIEALADKTYRERFFALKGYKPETHIEIAARASVKDKAINKDVDAKIKELQRQYKTLSDEEARLGNEEELAKEGGFYKYQDASQATREKHEEILNAQDLRENKYKRVARSTIEHLRDQRTNFIERLDAISNRIKELAEAAPKEPKPSADNFETMPEGELTSGIKRRQNILDAAEEAQRLDVQGKARSKVSIQADERLTETINTLISNEYQGVEDVTRSNRPSRQWSVKERELNTLKDRLETLQRAQKKNRSMTATEAQKLREMTRARLIDEMKSRINTDSRIKPSSPAAQAREELAEVAATATAEAVESRQPRAEDMSDEELTSAIKRQEAEVLDLETEIKDLKRQRQRYGDKSKKRKAAQAKLNELKTAQASRTGETVALKGEGSKVPAEDEMKSMISKLQKMVEQNPSLAKSPEVMALLGGGATQASDLPDTDLVITLGGKTQNIPVKYKIIEAGDAIGSHHAGGFYKRPDYPEGVQEREYHNARGPEQNKVIVQAQNLNPQLLANTNPDAMNGPPVLTQDGITLGGNSRVMSVQRAYMAHPEKAKAYKTYLYKKAHTFGIDPQELDKFSAPLLVRELTVEDKSKENLAKLVRAMNEGLTQEFDATAEGRNAATKLLGDNVTLKAIAGALRDAPESATLNSILKTPSTRLENIKRALFRDGIMTSRNSNKYIHEASGAFNDTGVSLVKKMITGYVLRDDELLRALSPRTEDNLNNALATLSAVGINREDAEDIQNAVFVYNLILNKDVATGGINSSQTPSDRDKRVKMYMEEDRAFDFGEGASDKINIERLKERVKKSPLSSAFLKILALNPSPRALNSTMKQFVKLVDVSDNMDMFAAAPIDFTAASKQIAQKLADQHKTSAELYKSRVRRGARSARAGLLLALA